MNIMEKRSSYDAGFKLKVIDLAKKSNNCAASRKYGVTEKMVRDWRRNENALKTIPRSKCAMRSGAPFWPELETPSWPELENYLEEWVKEQRQNGYVVTRGGLKAQAIRWAKLNEPLCRNFKATSGWCSRFMKRKDLVLRQKTKIAQKLPADLDDKVLDFQRYVIRLGREHQFLLSSIGNMDETPINFDMVARKTVDSKGVKGIQQSGFLLVCSFTSMKTVGWMKTA
ncbi:hypothetical protein M513_13929 [Trichuris suis]|uniref:HTH CENPB-type domain-containing protein n=1 Tax=Trichuris suis TaxID=68888 RepID=A0A085LJP8_9BILA|nr:hypothetical protein M513_13929 [Trichuris suis]